MIYLDNSASTKAFTQAAETVKKYIILILRRRMQPLFPKKRNF